MVAGHAGGVEAGIEDDWSYTEDWLYDTSSYIATTVSDDVGSAVSYSMDCSSQAGGCTGGCLLASMGLGALGGALGGALAGPLGGKLVSEALDGVLPDIAVNALVGAWAGAGSGAVMSGVDYGMNCASSKDGCSLGGALDAIGSGALTGAIIGGLAGAGGGSSAAESGESGAGETPAVGESSDAAAGEAAPAEAVPAEAAPAAEPEAAAEESPEEEQSCPVGPHSFVASTPVLMADGSTRPISQVKVVDQISDAVPGDSGQQAHAVQNVITTTTGRDFVDVTVKPSKLGKALAGVALAAAATLTTTFHHPFYDITQSAFVEAVDLKAGDQVQTADGGTATVTDVHAYHQQATTYDVTINGLHTYYVLAGNTGILVHNANGCVDTYRQATELAATRAEPETSTVAVAQVRSTTDPTVTDTWVSTEQPGLPEEWTGPGAPKIDARYIMGEGHAEQTIMNALGEEWELVSIASSTRMCSECLEQGLGSRLDTTNIGLGTGVSRTGNTPYRVLTRVRS